MKTLRESNPANQGRESRVKEARLSYGNFLKIVCAIIIVIYHYRHLALYSDVWHTREWLPLDAWFGLIYTYGYTVVELFFILSGFGLFCQFFLRSEESRRKVGCAGFLKPKLARLYPVFAMTALMCIILQSVAIAESGKAVLGLANENLLAYIQTFLMVKGGLLSSAAPYNVPTWFLTPLMLCYILFWIVFYGAKGLSDRTRVAIAAVLVVIGAIIVYNKMDYSVLNLRIGRGLASFFGGVVLGWICNSFQFNKPAMALCSLVFIVGSLCMVGAGFGGSLYLPSVFVWCALILLLECVPHSFFVRFERPNAAASSISYALFCTHYVILTAIAVIALFNPMVAFDYGHWWMFALYVVATLVLTFAMKGLGGKLTRLAMKA